MSGLFGRTANHQHCLKFHIRNYVPQSAGQLFLELISFFLAGGTYNALCTETSFHSFWVLRKLRLLPILNRSTATASGWTTCCFTSRTWRSCSFYFYVARSLWATGKMPIHSCRVLHVSCSVLLAVHVRQSSSIFATIQSSHANMSPGKLLLRKFSECYGISQLYLQMHSESSGSWNKKQWFLTVYLCIIAPDNGARKKKLYWRTNAEW
jgi:hypothetical protein